MIPFVENWGGGSSPTLPPQPELHLTGWPQGSLLEAMLLIASFAGYAIVSVLPVFMKVDSRVFTEPFRYLVVALTVFVLFKIREDSFRPGVNIFLVLFAGLWYLLFLRMLWHFFYPVYLADDKTLYELLQFSAGGTFLPALAILLRGKAEACSVAGRVLAIILPISCLLVLYCAFFVVPQEEAYIRLSIPALNPISVGNLGVTTLVIAVWRHVPQSSNPGFKILSIFWKILSALLGLVLLGLSASKGPIVAMLVVIIVAVLGKRDIGAKLKMTFRAVAVVAATVLILVAVEQETHYKPLLRISEALNPDQASEQEARGSLIVSSLKEFVENPLLGSAIVERETGEYPHNIIVEGFLVAGVLGGVLCIAIIGFASVAAWRIVVSGGEYAWVGLFFVQRLISVQLSGSLYTASEFWASAGLVMALASTILLTRAAASVEKGPGAVGVSWAEGRP